LKTDIYIEKLYGCLVESNPRMRLACHACQLFGRGMVRGSTLSEREGTKREIKRSVSGIEVSKDDWKGRYTDENVPHSITFLFKLFHS